jgi:hypothetical protein
MRHVAAPTHVGPDQWPVLSAVRIATAADPAEFVVLVDCGEGTPTNRYATLLVFIWPDHTKTIDGEYNLTFAQARHSLAERAGLLAKTTITVEVVVVRDPDYANDYTIFVDGQPYTGKSETVRVVTHDIDFGASPITSAWVAGQLKAADALSPAAAARARETVLAYAGDLPDDADDADADTW